MFLFLLSCAPAPIPAATLHLDTLAADAIELPDPGRQRHSPWVEVPLERRGTLLRGPSPFRSVRLHRPNNRAPNGFQLPRQLSGVLTYAERLDEPWTWRISGKQIQVHVPEGEELPSPFKVRYAPAVERERERNPATAKDPQAFVQRQMQVGDTTSSGLFLPTDTRISWQIELPRDARFRTDAHLLDPEIVRTDRPPRPIVEVRARVEGEVVGTASCQPRPDDPCELALDLAVHAGRKATLELASRSPLKQQRDVFLANPTLYTPRERPRRVVMIYADTFRADRLGALGAEHPTPNLDRLVGGAMLFENARSVATWTLPSVRAVRSGRKPESWDESTSLAQTLRDAGFQTVGLANNPFTSNASTIGKGFATYRYENLASATVQVEQALAALETYADRDLLLSVQFMDTHLPYREPEPWASMFTDPDAPYPRRFTRSYVTGLDDAERRTYVEARYDQTVQYLDAALAPLIDALHEDDVVVFFSDHGEELWEHGTVEHGHAVWDEVVRVPLAVRAPGFTRGRAGAPVSLIDITPTVLDLVDLPLPPEVEGRSLVPLMRGDAAAAKAFHERPQLIGRTLWSGSAWALLDDTDKTIAQDGAFAAYDLAADPGELSPTPLDAETGARTRDQMSSLLGQDFVEALSIRGPRRELRERGATISVALEGPIAGAWRGERTPQATARVKDNQATFTTRGAVPGELYVLPQRGEPQGSIRIEHGGKVRSHRFTRADLEDGHPLEGSLPLRLQLDQVVAPGGVVVPDTVEGQEEELKALGYIE